MPTKFLPPKIAMMIYASFPHLMDTSERALIFCGHPQAADPSPSTWVHLSLTASPSVWTS